jgi:transposase
MAHVSVLGIDITKPMFPVVGLDDTGTVVLRKRCPRGALMSFSAQMSPAVSGMAACGGAHDWARRFRGYGHTATLMAPQRVKPSVKANTHEMADAEAMGEAVTRPAMRFVPIEELAPQDFQAMHRVRARLVNARTALITESRGWRSA